MLAFELGEQTRWHLAKGVDQHIEPASVCHTDHHLLHAGGACLLDEMIEHRDHGVATFAGKALLTDVLGAEIFFQRFSSREPFQNVLAELRRVVRARAQRLQSLLDEALLRRVRHVHVLGAEGAAIGLLEGCDQVLEPHAAGAIRRAFERTDVVLGVHVGACKAVGRDVEVCDVRAFLPLQRVEIGVEHAERSKLGA